MCDLPIAPNEKARTAPVTTICVTDRPSLLDLHSDNNNRVLQPLSNRSIHLVTVRLTVVSRLHRQALRRKMHLCTIR